MGARGRPSAASFIASVCQRAPRVSPQGVAGLGDAACSARAGLRRRHVHHGARHPRSAGRQVGLRQILCGLAKRRDRRPFRDLPTRFGLSVRGSAPSTAAGAMDQRPSGRSWHTQSSIVSSAAPVALRTMSRAAASSRAMVSPRRSRSSSPGLLRHAIGLVFLKSATGDIAMICAVGGAPISLQRTPRLRPCRDIARHAPRTRLA